VEGKSIRRKKKTTLEKQQSLKEGDILQKESEGDTAGRGGNGRVKRSQK